MVGEPDADFADWIRLRKHGADGGICRRWVIDDDDYIRKI